MKAQSASCPRIVRLLCMRVTLWLLTPRTNSPNYLCCIKAPCTRQAGYCRVFVNRAGGFFRLAVKTRRLMITWADTIFQRKGSDPERIKPLRHLLAFMNHTELHVSAAGADHDGCPGRFFRRWQIDSQNWPVGVLAAHGARRAIGPK